MSSIETYRNFQMNIHVELTIHFIQPLETNLLVSINQCKSFNSFKLMAKAKLHIIKNKIMIQE